MNFMSKPTVLKTVSILSFIVSALFTVQLMTSGTIGLFSFFLSMVMAIIFEVVKCGFFFKALTDKNINSFMRFVLGSISIILVLASIFASAGYITNQANKSKNKELQTSTEFKQLQEGRNIQSQEFEIKKNELLTLNENKRKTISDMEKIRDSYPKNYITVKENMSYNINQKAAELQKIIDMKSAELNKLSSTLSTPLDTTKFNVTDTKGYIAMFKIIADSLNKSEDFINSPITANELEMWFFICLGIIFEVVAILTAYLAQLETNNSNPVIREENKKVILFRPRPRDVKTLSPQYTQDEYNDYLNYLLNNPKKNGDAPGRDTICKALGLEIEKGRSIHGELIRKGIIRTEINRTLYNKRRTAEI